MNAHRFPNHPAVPTPHGSRTYGPRSPDVRPTPHARRFTAFLVAGLVLWSCGCAFLTPREQRKGPPYDRPFPLGQVTDSHWETQQTNAEASDFVFYDHEFEGSTAKLTPAGKKHLWQVAVRLEHVPFPIVVEELPDLKNPALNAQRRQAIVDQLVKLGYEQTDVDSRVVVAPALAPGLSAVEAEQAYYSTLRGDFEYGGGTGRRFSGYGGRYR